MALKSYGLTGRAQRAMSIGRFAYQHRADIMRARAGLIRMRRSKAARRIQSRFRRSRKPQRFNMATVGRPLGTSNTKQSVVTDLSLVGRGTRILYTKNMCSIPQFVTGSPDVTASNKRIREIIQLSGLKLNMQWRNLSDALLQCHVAILAPTQSTIVTLTEFFRDPENQERARTFSSTLSSIEFQSLPVNSDKYTILMHKRFNLGPKDTAVVNDNVIGEPNYKTIKKYLKVNRQLRYQDSSNPIDGNIWLCYWCDRLLADEGTGSLAAAFQATTYIQQYFRETPN